MQKLIRSWNKFLNTLTDHFLAIFSSTYSYKKVFKNFSALNEQIILKFCTMTGNSFKITHTNFHRVIVSLTKFNNKITWFHFLMFLIDDKIKLILIEFNFFFSIVKTFYNQFI